MCINPVELPNGQTVACHKCWQCVRRKIDDWMGRCIAESQTARAVHSVTLTYGRDAHYDAVDHVKAAVLTYSDVQKYLRSWRDEGIKVRYFIVGEYGSMKGRAHWHCLLFWPDLVPDRELGKNIECPMWKHGHSFWKTGTPATVRYVTKYIAKEVETEERDYHMGLSKYPPLGDLYFRQLAARLVEARLAPQDLFYSFDEARDKKGKLLQFVMQGKTRENFIRYFRDGWWDAYGDHAPNSEILEAFEDAEAAKGDRIRAKAIIAAEKVKMAVLSDTVRKDGFTGFVSKPKLENLRSWMKPEGLKFSEKLNVWMYLFDGEQGPWYWAKDAEGIYEWREKVGASVKDYSDPVNRYRAARG